jgi:hypothetical protein
MAITLILPTDAQANIIAPKPPQAFYDANKVTLLSGTRGVDLLRTTVSIASQPVQVLSTVVTSPISPNSMGEADVMISLNGEQAKLYTATIR